VWGGSFALRQPHLSLLCLTLVPADISYHPSHTHHPSHPSLHSVHSDPPQFSTAIDNGTSGDWIGLDNNVNFSHLYARALHKQNARRTRVEDSLHRLTLFRLLQSHQCRIRQHLGWVTAVQLNSTVSTVPHWSLLSQMYSYSFPPTQATTDSEKIFTIAVMLVGCKLPAHLQSTVLPTVPPYCHSLTYCNSSVVVNFLNVT